MSFDFGPPLDFEPELEFDFQQQPDIDYNSSIREPEVDFEQQQEIHIDDDLDSFKRDIELLRAARRDNASPYHTRNSLEPDVEFEQEQKGDTEDITNSRKPNDKVSLEADREDDSPPPSKRRRVDSSDSSITSETIEPEASAAMSEDGSNHGCENYFRINVYWVFGVLTYVYVQPTSTIADVKAAICRYKDIPPIQQQLKIDENHDELQDDQTMSEAGIKSGQRLALHLCGGVFAAPDTADDLTVTPKYPYRSYDGRETFPIVVKDWTGFVAPFRIDNNCTAEDIKHCISNETSVPPCRQRVYLRGKLLDGEDLVKDASILREDWIYVKLGPCGYATRPEGCDVHGKA